jgi:hypothetical protein
VPGFGRGIVVERFFHGMWKRGFTKMNGMVEKRGGYRGRKLREDRGHTIPADF